MLHHDGSSVYIQQNLRVGQRLRLAAKRELNLDSHCHNIVSSLCKQPDCSVNKSLRPCRKSASTSTQTEFPSTRYAISIHATCSNPHVTWCRQHTPAHDHCSSWDTEEIHRRFLQRRSDFHFHLCSLHLRLLHSCPRRGMRTFQRNYNVGT